MFRKLKTLVSFLFIFFWLFYFFLLTWNRLPEDVFVQGDEDGGMAVTQGPQPQGQVTLAEQVIGHVHPVCNGGEEG